MSRIFLGFLVPLQHLCEMVDRVIVGLDNLGNVVMGLDFVEMTIVENIVVEIVAGRMGKVGRNLVK